MKIALAIALLVLAGCASNPASNPLSGRQTEFDRRLAAAGTTPAWAYQNCRRYQRDYVEVLNHARTGELTLIELISFERAYDLELKILERR